MDEALLYASALQLERAADEYIRRVAARLTSDGNLSLSHETAMEIALSSAQIQIGALELSFIVRRLGGENHAHWCAVSDEFASILRSEMGV